MDHFDFTLKGWPAVLSVDLLIAFFIAMFLRGMIAIGECRAMKVNLEDLRAEATDWKEELDKWLDEDDDEISQ